MPTYWADWLRERFGDREVLPRAHLRTLFDADLPSGRLDEFFDFFELEYLAPAGILRPSDNLERLTQPIDTRNPLRWFAVEPGLEDKASELAREASARAKAAGLTIREPLRTVREYVRVWCGQAP